MKLKIATMMFTWNGVGDRFLKQYFKPKKAQDVFSEISGSVIGGVELQYGNHVNNENLPVIKQELARHNLQPVIVNTPLAGNIAFRKGSITSDDPAVRREAIDFIKGAMDASRVLGSNKISCFFGQDGFDYPLTTDYAKIRTYFREAFVEVCNYAPDVKIAIEYKPKEPRCRQFLDSASKVLLMASELDLPNMGLLLDVGHAWMAGENVGEIIELAASQNRLFHIHLNDNFRVADDDLGVGGIHLAEYIELLYWLERVSYDGYVSMDVHSPREISREIIQESAEFIKLLSEKMTGQTLEAIEELLETRDGSRLIRFIRTSMLS